MARIRRSRASDDQPVATSPSGARHFLYLDSDLTRQLLSGLEHGLYGIERTATEEESTRRGGADLGVHVVGAGVGIHGERATMVGTRVERDLEQTPESQFSRLVDTLRRHSLLRHLESIDRQEWDELRPGDMLEVVGSFRISSNTLASAVALARAISRQEGEPASAPAEGKLLTRVAAARRFTTWIYGVLRSTPGVEVDPELHAELLRSPEFKFSGKLNALELRTKLERDDQRGAILAKLERPREDSSDVTVVGIYR